MKNEKKCLVYIVFIFIFSSCIHKTTADYKELFMKNKKSFFQIRNYLQEIINSNDTLYKINAIFTGKLLLFDTYVNDSTIFNFINLDDTEESQLSHIMYLNNINVVTAYKDSIKYIFKGRYKDTIVYYNFPTSLEKQSLIDTNTYLIFENRSNQ